jgi:3-isopropylmalate dehydrogenase
LKANIVLLPGDGIGPEVIHAARRVLEAVAQHAGHDFVFSEHDIGGIALDRHGDPLPPATLDACSHADGILLGAVGGPQWDDPGLKRRPEQGLLGLRSTLKVFANIRPVRTWASLVDISPLRPERVRGVDFIVVRELTGGLYFGTPKFRERLPDGGERAVDTMEYTDAEVRRVARIAFDLAASRRGRLSSVDKANVLETSRLWRQVVDRMASGWPSVTVEHRLVDSAAMRLVTEAQSFDVIVTENTFGDILTDEAAVLVGSLGLLPSASIGDGGPGLYEPIHGSAPDIAGRGIANPIGAILSGAMLLRLSLGLEREAAQIEKAVEKALDAGVRTRDIGGHADTVAMSDAIIAAL